MPTLTYFRSNEKERSTKQLRIPIRVKTVAQGNNAALGTHENDVKSESQTPILTRDEVDGQGRSYIAPLTKQLEDLTRLMQGMSSTQQLKFSPGFSAAGQPPDIKTQLVEQQGKNTDSVNAFTSRLKKLQSLCVTI